MQPAHDHPINLEKLKSIENQYRDKRNYYRFEIRGDAEILPVNQKNTHQQPLQIQLRDIERTGIGFICPQKLKRGDLYRVHFIKDSYQAEQAIMRVCHCDMINDNIYFIGAQFCCENSLMLMYQVNEQIPPQPQQQPHLKLSNQK